LGTEKLLTKSKPKYFPEILRAKKPKKIYKLQEEKMKLHRVFLVSFLLCNSFVLPPHGRLKPFLDSFSYNFPLSSQVLNNTKFISNSLVVILIL